MSRIFLLRHAQSVANEKGFLAGRMGNIELSKKGLLQRAELERRLSGAKFDQVISSPIQRCLDTIKNFDSNPQIENYFQEVHYGDWTGKKFSALNRSKAWREIHKHPASVRFPNGETLPEVQIRALAGLDHQVRSSSKNVLIATHGDVVRVLVLHALGSHINNIDKFEIDNASITVLERTGRDLRVLTVNNSSAEIKDLLK
jgi:broad specificity phosphatase PhoE